MLARHACQLPNHPESAGRARAWIRAMLAADGCDEDVIHTARLIVSELATNGLIHGSRHRSDTITIVCDVDTDILTVGVIDYGTDRPVVLDAAEDDEARPLERADGSADVKVMVRLGDRYQFVVAWPA